MIPILPYSNVGKTLYFISKNHEARIPLYGSNFGNCYEILNIFKKIIKYTFPH